MSPLTDPVGEAYDGLAFAYDVLTADYAYDRWLAHIEDLARSHGLTGRRLLDVGCGTGKSFLPLLARGYEVTACDLSEQMVRRAAARAPAARVTQADMRALPLFGEFDLVTCLDDALNHLTNEPELTASLRGIRRNLAPAGVAVWDVNTLATYRSAFASAWVTERDGVFVAWQGSTPPDFAGRQLATVAVHAFQELPDGGWQRSTSLHRQRHWTRGEIERAARAAGLEVRAVVGQRTGVLLEPELDEDRHTKALFVARRIDWKGGEAVLGRP